MPVPNTFANATATIPLSQLDANFATTITLGNTAIQLGNTVSTLNNMTLANVTVTSGNVTITNVTVTTANVTTANIATAVITTANVTTANITTGNVSGNITFTGTGNRITGDFSNTTLANRVMFQTSTANSATVVSAIPNGTSVSAQIQLFNNSDPTNAGRLQFAVGSTEAQIFSSISGTGTYLPMTFYTGGSERMRVDTAGNLGLGVTPSAWSGVGAALQVGTSAAIIGNSANSSSFISNAYFDGTNYRYIGTGFATRFATTSGGYSWNQAASGTAGNTITFTQAMTLDASGNLSLANGTFSLTKGTGSTTYRNGITLEGDGTTTNHVSPAIAFSGQNINASIWSSRAGGGFGGNLIFGTQGGSSGDPTERARITSDGVFMVGTTGLSANGTACSFSGSSRVVRIYGTTQADGAFMVDKSTNVSTTAQVFIQFSINAQATGNGQINANGANAAAFGTFSDRRLKENIVDLPPQLDNILALRPVEFDFIESEGGGHQLGFIAQEVQEVYPDLVGERSDGMLTLSDMNKNDARLIKAFQELAAKVQALEAEVQALKGNA